MSSMTVTGTHSSTTTKQKVGLVICGLYSLANIPGFLGGEPDPGTEGPPMAILVVGSLLGVVGLVAAVLAWRGNRVALRVAAGAIILITLTGLPAFFVDVPMVVKALVAFSVVLTLVTVVLMLSTVRGPSRVTD
jgi:hypothetical protein